MVETEETHTAAAALGRELAQVCGIANAASAKLVGLIGGVLQSEAWEGYGIRSPEHWVTWKCGVSAGRAWWRWPAAWATWR